MYLLTKLLFLLLFLMSTQIIAMIWPHNLKGNGVVDQHNNNKKQR